MRIPRMELWPGCDPRSGGSTLDTVQPARSASNNNYGSMKYPTDTSANAEHVLIEGYRRMAPAEKLGRVVSLNRALVELAAARLRAQYGANMKPRELLLYLLLHRDGRTSPCSARIAVRAPARAQ